MVSPMWWRGVKVCDCIPPAVEAMEALYGKRVIITQGGYNAGAVSASAGTHDRGGALDLATPGNDTDDIKQIWAARTVGWSAWVRQPDEGPWNQHTHMVLNGCIHRAYLAAQQEVSLRNGRNGLKNQALDPHRSLGLPVVTYAEYMEGKMANLDEEDREWIRGQFIWQNDNMCRPTKQGVAEIKALLQGTTNPTLAKILYQLGQMENGGLDLSPEELQQFAQMLATAFGPELAKALNEALSQWAVPLGP